MSFGLIILPPEKALSEIFYRFQKGLFYRIETRGAAE
jgi:hypothetical protein